MDEKELNREGCEYGRVTKLTLEGVESDMDRIGKKVGNLYNLGWAILLTMLATLCTLVGTLLAKRI